VAVYSGEEEVIPSTTAHTGVKHAAVMEGKVGMGRLL